MTLNIPPLLTIQCHLKNIEKLFSHVSVDTAEFLNDIIAENVDCSIRRRNMSNPNRDELLAEIESEIESTKHSLELLTGRHPWLGSLPALSSAVLIIVAMTFSFHRGLDKIATAEKALGLIEKHHGFFSIGMRGTLFLKSYLHIIMSPSLDPGQLVTRLEEYIDKSAAGTLADPAHGNMLDLLCARSSKWDYTCGPQDKDPSWHLNLSSTITQSLPCLGEMGQSLIGDFIPLMNPMYTRQNERQVP